MKWVWKIVLNIPKIRLSYGGLIYYKIYFYIHTYSKNCKKQSVNTGITYLHMYVRCSVNYIGSDYFQTNT